MSLLGGLFKAFRKKKRKPSNEGNMLKWLAKNPKGLESIGDQEVKAATDLANQETQRTTEEGRRRLMQDIAAFSGGFNNTVASDRINQWATDTYGQLASENASRAIANKQALTNNYVDRLRNLSLGGQQFTSNKMGIDAERRAQRNKRRVGNLKKAVGAGLITGGALSGNPQLAMQGGSLLTSG